jgi:hypothetical protein
VIQHVTLLTPTEFAEETVATVMPTSGAAYRRGRHTLTAVGDQVLVDGHRDVFVPHALRAFLVLWLGGRARS